MAMKFHQILLKTLGTFTSKDKQLYKLKPIKVLINMQRITTMYCIAYDIFRILITILNSKYDPLPYMMNFG